MNAPVDPQFAARCRASFDRQKAMMLIGARLTAVEPGATEIALAYREDLTQQKGFVHGGIIGMIADTACGYAAYLAHARRRAPSSPSSTRSTSSPRRAARWSPAARW